LVDDVHGHHGEAAGAQGEHADDARAEGGKQQGGDHDQRAHGDAQRQLEGPRGLGGDRGGHARVLPRGHAKAGHEGQQHHSEINPQAAVLQHGEEPTTQARAGGFHRGVDRVVDVGVLAAEQAAEAQQHA